MKKIAIICTLLLALLGVTFLNGQNVKSSKKENNHVAISKHDDSQSIELEQENGKILRFSINGRTIPAGEYANHQAIIDDLLTNVPEPPTAPDIPLPSAPPSPPTPPINLADAQQDEANFEATLETQMEAQKVHLKMMYEEKARIRKEAIEAAQRRKGKK